MIMKNLTRVKSCFTRPNKAISPSEIPRMTTLAGLPPSYYCQYPTSFQLLILFAFPFAIADFLHCLRDK